MSSYRAYLFTEIHTINEPLDPDDGNVIVWAKQVTLDQLKKAFHSRGMRWTDATECRPDEAQYYIHDDLYLTEKEEKRAIQLAKESVS